MFIIRLIMLQGRVWKGSLCNYTEMLIQGREGTLCNLINVLHYLRKKKAFHGRRRSVPVPSAAAAALAMAGILPFPLTTFQVQFKASSSSDRCSQCMSLIHSHSHLNYSRGLIPPLRFPKFSFNLLQLKSHRKIGIAFAESTGQLDRTVKIRFGNNATVTSEPVGTTQLKVTVNLNSKATRKAFDTILEGLRRSAPPVEGFRKLKGGKPDIPREILYRMMGPKTVDKFVVEEIVTSSVLEYVEKEGIKVKNDFKTVQSNDELAGSFKAGKDFGFDAIVELEESETEGSESSALNLNVSDSESTLEGNET